MKLFAKILVFYWMIADTAQHEYRQANITTFTIEELFYKYSTNSNSLSLNNLNEFIENFFKSISPNNYLNGDNILNENRSLCLSKHFNKITNLTRMLNNETLVNKKKLSTISLYLVSYVDKCLSNKNQQHIYHETETPTQQNAETTNVVQSMLANAMKQSKEGI